MMGHLQVSACELFNGPSLICALRAEGPLVYRCGLHGTKLYSSPGPNNHWTVDDWKHAAWSDEFPFQLYRTDARVRVWRRHH
ncbi:hypothetical protein AVEN_221405-1 [Araneus ventricosus]|uniref:Uncharacterized protein n=1 Tax=Araneus ventricosus TaxID=182803 RepID=A0A4Y2HGZ1_ARAVE|nr:hypothetical protein AVEN_228717-1 [Araneus ventricosus]GBM64344.1 hypothetical protein AVEN_9256-1 [Araneus ventricosus]GBM64585.1 hypothetical protein AVEN_184343-1 [Araneus ventricosus]GBM65820.1 hypothetical protein AVEN_221405-1 [Araneus ventricosus]